MEKRIRRLETRIDELETNINLFGIRIAEMEKRLLIASDLMQKQIEINATVVKTFEALQK